MAKITRLEVENIKRVKAVSLEPAQNGLTVIGGRNGQGKTSVLDSIAWALGGDKYKPSQATRDGSVIPPSLHVELDNGLIVERTGKNSTLKVIDPRGNKGGQQLLDGLIDKLALDLPRFLQSNSHGKADTLLKIIGVGDKLYALDQQIERLYNKRHERGQIAEQKKSYAAELPTYDGVPDSPVSASELIRQQQEILARNGENQRKRQQLATLEIEHGRLCEDIAEMTNKLAEMSARRDALYADIETARKTAAQLSDESTAELERNIANIEQINIRVRANLDRSKADDEAKEYADQYAELTAQIDKLRCDRLSLLNGADLPLPGLSVSDKGELTYNGCEWDCMSGADQLRVATAIVRKINPQCGFVLMDKLEQMDTETLREFGQWLESEGLQVIATRVSTGDECSIIIEDGYIAGEPQPEPAATTEPQGGYWS